MFSELTNGNYWCYVLEQDGVGIVRANNLDEARQKVKDAYTKHSDDPFTEEINIYEIYQKPFDDAPDVIEICE